MFKILLATGPVGSDDMSYFQGAAEILDSGKLGQVNHQLGRILYIVLAGIPAVLGGHIWYGAMANIFYATLLDIAVAVFAYRALGPLPAVAATLITGFNGVALLWSGTLLPDMALSLFMFLSTVAVYHALRHGAGTPFSLLMMGGVLAGLSYAVKDPGILLLPPAAICISILPRDDSLGKRAVSLAAYLGSFAAIFALLGAVQKWLSGDFLYQAHAVAAVHNKLMPTMSLYNYCRYVWWSIVDIGTNARYILPPMAAGLVAWCAAIVKPGWDKVFAITGLFVTGYLIFGSTSLIALKPMPMQTRYLAPIMPLAAVSIAAWLADVSTSSPARKAAWIVFMAVFALTSLFGSATRAGQLVRARYFKNMASAVETIQAQTPESQILADHNLLAILHHFLPQSAYGKLKEIPENSELPGGYYLVDFLRFTKNRRATIPHYDEISNLPIAMAIDLDQRILSGYFPSLLASTQKPLPEFVAMVRKK